MMNEETPRNRQKCRRKVFARQRRGASIVVVLGLLSITLAASYAMVHSHVTSERIQGHWQRRKLARRAAQAGLSLALSRMHLSSWEGVEKKIIGELSKNTRYEVTFATGDERLRPEDKDYGEYPFRLTLTSIGIARSFREAAVMSTCEMTAVVQLKRTSLATPVDGEVEQAWKELAPYSLYCSGRKRNYVYSPIRLEGNMWWAEGCLSMRFPRNSDARQRFFGDAHELATKSVVDHRPLLGSVTLTKRNQSRMQSELRRCRIDVPVNKSEVKIDRLFSDFKVPRTYQLYRGGVEYVIPIVSRELKDEALEPNVVANPLGVFATTGDVIVGDNVRIRGTLLQSGKGHKINLAGKNIEICAVELPAVEESPRRRQLPVAVVEAVNLAIGSAGSICGVAHVLEDFACATGQGKMKWDIQGRLAAGDLQIKTKPTDLAGPSVWKDLLESFREVAEEFSEGESHNLLATYFPLWLQERRQFDLEPILTVRPKATEAEAHWPDWERPIYVSPPGKTGLRWEVVRWSE